MLHDFHLLTAEAAARLLKSIEEPPPSTTFLVLADFVPPELITIASRCVRIDFRSIPDRRAGRAAASPRACADVRSTTSWPRPAATSPGPASSPPTPTSSNAARAFAAVPAAARRHRRDGRWRRSTTCSPASRPPPRRSPTRHAAEVAELEARIERFGERGSGRKALEERHKRELRRHRTDELRSGLGVLAGAYRDILVSGVGAAPPGASSTP